MGDISEEWEIEEEDSSCPEESKSSAMWILDKGLNVGKKIVITGVVISSAPFVLPPIMVISAIGFALSIPSGILLTSYACTEKLMSKLFPVTGPDYHSITLEQKNKELEEGYLEDDEELADEYQGKAIENENRGLGEEKGKEGYGYEEEPLTREANIKRSYDDVTATKKDVDMEHKGSEEKDTGEKNPTVVTTKKEDIQEGKNKKKIDADVKGETVAGKSDEKDVGVTMVAEKTVGNDDETSKKSSRKKKGNKKQNAGSAPEELQEKKEEEKVDQPTKVGAREIPIETPEDRAELRSSAKVPESKQAAATPTGKEVGVSEESIQERLDALRSIVGYKSSPHGTYVAELRALYMFTGVEPPVSMKDSSDLVEVYEKLGLLMSIVGVK